VLITPSHGTKEGREMPGIRHIYQFKANKYNIGREICYRTLTCWCVSCTFGNYEDCIVGSAWLSKDLYGYGAVAPTINEDEDENVIHDNTDNMQVDQLGDDEDDA